MIHRDLQPEDDSVSIMTHPFGRGSRAQHGRHPGDHLYLACSGVNKIAVVQDSQTALKPEIKGKLKPEMHLHRGE